MCLCFFLIYNVRCCIQKQVAAKHDITEILFKCDLFCRSHVAQTATSKSSKSKLSKLVSTLEDEFNADEDIYDNSLHCALNLFPLFLHLF